MLSRSTRRKPTKKCQWHDCEDKSGKEHSLVKICRIYPSGNLHVVIYRHYLTQAWGWTGSRTFRSTIPGGVNRDTYRKARNRARKYAAELGCKMVDEFGRFGLDLWYFENGERVTV